MDVHTSLLGEDVPWTYQHTDHTGKLSASRIDLILASHSAMGLVCDASVLSDIRDGGHSPVVVDIIFTGSPSISWQRPQPRLPPLLQLSSPELRGSPEWQDLMSRWCQSPQAMQLQLADPSTRSLSAALDAALRHLVTMAGGWVTRPAARGLQPGGLHMPHPPSGRFGSDYEICIGWNH